MISYSRCEPNRTHCGQSHDLPAGATGIRNRPGIPGLDDLSEPAGRASRGRRTGLVRPATALTASVWYRSVRDAWPSPSSSPQPELSPDSAVAPRAPANLQAWCRQLAFRRTVGLRRIFYAVLGMVLSRSAVLAGWQCRQGVELGLVQSDVGRGGVGGDLHFSFRADDRRGDRRAG